ncbi:ionotropic receptor 25a-like [Limulus polyphemus]|uniref:Ionotropic receptor 25a-like n=1 Tax=Limulus polyphemus TaxID=6850 RepID=A0ABM1SRJ1_LIMPO|nr:ionotropic receptor 25a-like [Limulus polyphemus]
MEEEKLNCIQEAPAPVTKQQVRSFLGLAGCYRKFIENYAEVTSALMDLTKQPPFVMKQQFKNGTIKFYGYAIDLLNLIQEDLHFEYNLKECVDCDFGRKSQDGGLKGNWSGLIGALENDRAHIAAGAIPVTRERLEVVDFTVPIYDMVGYQILMKLPKVPNSMFKFLSVLDVQVWILIICCYVFSCLLLFVYHLISPFSYRNNKQKYGADRERRDFNIKECMWFCMTSLTPQGGGEAPRNISGKLVAATWWAFGFIAIVSFTANLAASMTVSRMENTISSLDDLVNQHKVKYAPEADSDAMIYFERMAYIEEIFYEYWKAMTIEPTKFGNKVTTQTKLSVFDYPLGNKYTKLLANIRKTAVPHSFEDGIKSVLNLDNSQPNGFAFIADAIQVKYATMKDCDLIAVGNEFSRKPVAFAVQKGSPLKDQLSTALLKLLNERSLEKLNEIWWDKNPEKVSCSSSEAQVDGIDISNVGGVFIIIGTGVVVAIIIVTVEFCYYNKYNPRKDAKKKLGQRP